MTKNLADELQRTARQAMTSLSPAPQGEEGGGLPFRRLLAAVFRARYLVFATTLFGTLIGAFLALTTPNTYVSTGKFQFTSLGAEATRSDASRTTDVSQETIGTSATYILSSNDLMMKVVERLTPARILEPYRPGSAEDSGAKGWFYRVQRDWNATKDSEATPEEALKRLLRTVTIERPRSTDMLIATCTATNQQLAQEILSVFMDESIQWHIAQYDDKRVYEAAEARAKNTEGALHAARLAKREFLARKARVPDFDEEKARLQGTATTATIRQMTLKEDADTRRKILDGLVKQIDVDKSFPVEIQEKRRVDISSTILRSYEEALGRATLELSALERTYTNHEDPAILAQKRAISDLDQSVVKLREKQRSAPEELSNVPNPAYRSAVEERNRLTREVATVEAQLTYATTVATEAVANLKTLLDLEPEYEQLRDALVGAEDNDKAAQIIWNAAQQKRALGLGNFSSLKRIQTPTLPLEKEGPNRSRLLIGAFFGGLFAGLGIILLRSLPDTFVRTRDDLEKIEGLPVIGVMPRFDGGNLRRHISLREQGW